MPINIGSVRSPIMPVLAVLLGVAAGPAAASMLVTGFEGTSQIDNCNLGLNSCFRPPDTMGAVGTTQFLETTNGSVTVYDKATQGVVLRQTSDAFWQGLGITGATGGVYTGGDQRVLFDHYTNRWLAVGFGTSSNRLNIGVSDTSDALGGWKSTSFAALPTGNTADYPTLGLDDRGIYIGTNNFNASNSFSGTSLFVIPKADIFGGAPSLAGMTRFDATTGDTGFTFQGALNWGGNADNTARIMAVSNLVFRAGSFRVSGVDAPGATRTSLTVSGPTYLALTDGRQPDGTRLVDTLDDRISSNAVQLGHRVYTIQTVGDASGFTKLQWLVTDAATGAALGSGTIAEAGYDLYQGSIAVNEHGEVVIGYNRSGYTTADGNLDGKPDGRITFMARVMQVSGDSLVAVGDPILLRVSDVSDYRCGPHETIDLSCRQRWGDYAAVTIDPTDHHTFYAIGEYAADWAVLPNLGIERAVWHTYIGVIDLDGAATATPEPGTAALVGFAVAMLAWRRRAVGTMPAP